MSKYKGLLDNDYDLEMVAGIAHEANRAYCQSIGDYSQKPWDEAPEWQRESAMEGVRNVLLTEATAEQSHENWLKHKLEEGWTYGPEKDDKLRTHPCMVKYSKLPEEQRIKDHIFRNVVMALGSLYIRGHTVEDAE